MVQMVSTGGSKPSRRAAAGAKSRAPQTWHVESVDYKDKFSGYTDETQGQRSCQKLRKALLGDLPPAFGMRGKVALILTLTPLGRFWDTLQTLISVIACGIYVASTYGFVEPLWLDVTFTVLFSVDYLIRFYASENRAFYPLQFFPIVDLLAVLPSYIEYVTAGQGSEGDDGSSGGGSLTFLRFIRVLRVIRILRAFKIINTALSIVTRQMLILGLTVTSIVFLSAGLVHVAEQELYEEFQGRTRAEDLLDELTFGDALYFIIVTVATVGFGDIAPRTGFGKAVVSLFVVVTVVVIPMQVNALTALLAQQSRYRTTFVPRNGEVPHVLVIGHVNNASMLRDLVEEFYHAHRMQGLDERYRERKMVIMGSSEPSEDVQGLLRNPLYDTRLTFIRGTVMSKSDLTRVAVGRAEAVFVLTDPHADNLIEADRQTALRMLLVRNYNPTLRIYAHTIGNEGGQYVQSSDVDSLVVAAEVKACLLAQSCLTPGFSTMVNNLLRSAALPDVKVLDSWSFEFVYGASLDVYAVPVPRALDGLSFTDLATMVYNAFDGQAVVWGVRDTKVLGKIRATGGSGRVLLNPGPTYKVKRRQLMYVMSWSENVAIDCSQSSFYETTTLPSVLAGSYGYGHADEYATRSREDPSKLARTWCWRPEWRAGYQGLLDKGEAQMVSEVSLSRADSLPGAEEKGIASSHMGSGKGSGSAAADKYGQLSVSTAKEERGGPHAARTKPPRAPITEPLKAPGSAASSKPSTARDGRNGDMVSTQSSPRGSEFGGIAGLASAKSFMWATRKVKDRAAKKAQYQELLESLVVDSVDIGPHRLEDHVIIVSIGVDSIREIINLLRARHVKDTTLQKPLVLLTSYNDSSQVAHIKAIAGKDDVYVVLGNATSSTDLYRAGIATASCMLVVGSNQNSELDGETLDSEVLFTYLQVEQAVASIQTKSTFYILVEMSSMRNMSVLNGKHMAARRAYMRAQVMARRNSNDESGRPSKIMAHIHGGAHASVSDLFINQQGLDDVDDALFGTQGSLDATTVDEESVTCMDILNVMFSEEGLCCCRRKKQPLAARSNSMIRMSPSNSRTTSSPGEGGRGSPEDSRTFLQRRRNSSVLSGAKDAMSPLNRKDSMLSPGSMKAKTRDREMSMPFFAAGFGIASDTLHTILCESFYNPEVSVFAEELLRPSPGAASRLIREPVPREYHGRDFGTLFADMLVKYNAVCVGLYRCRAAKGSPLPYVFTGPPPDTQVFSLGGQLDYMFLLSLEPLNLGKIASITPDVLVPGKSAHDAESNDGEPVPMAVAAGPVGLQYGRSSGASSQGASCVTPIAQPALHQMKHQVGTGRGNVATMGVSTMVVRDDDDEGPKRSPREDLAMMLGGVSEGNEDEGSQAFTDSRGHVGSRSGSGTFTQRSSSTASGSGAARTLVQPEQLRAVQGSARGLQVMSRTSEEGSVATEDGDGGAAPHAGGDSTAAAAAIVQLPNVVESDE